MRYCGNRDCPQTRYFSDDEEWCSVCRTSLTPCIRCLCGEEELNPRNPHEVKACKYCGERFTPTYVGQCMKAQLGELVQQVSQKLSSVQQISLN